MAIPSSRERPTHKLLMADWSDLPADLVHHISKKLSSLPDFIRFRSVCAKFRSSTSASDPPPQLPWLLELRDPFNADNSSLLRFYSLLSNTVHTITCPNSVNKWLKGPSHQYLLVIDYTTDEMSLLNPISNTEVPLPFLDVAAAWPDGIGKDIVVVSGDSLVISGDSFYTNTDKRILAFCRPGDRKWVTMEEGFYDCHGHLYFDGMYFTVDKTTGITKVIELASQTVLHVVPPAKTQNCVDRMLSYLVESNGDILRVIQYLDKERSFDIYRLDFGDGSVGPSWVEINGVGNQVLFLDPFHGFRGLSFGASDFAGLRGNCIYFFKGKSDNVDAGCILCRYDIENDMIEVLACPFENGGTWIVPSLC